MGQREYDTPQFELKGTVKGEENGEPVSKVDVYIIGGGQTWTNVLGEFKIKARIGDQLVISSPEFETIQHTITSREDIEVRITDYQAGQTSQKMKAQEREDKHRKFIDSAKAYLKKDIDKSIAFIEQSLKVLRKRGNSKQAARSFSTLGDIYAFWEQYDLAISNYKTSIEQDDTPNTRIQLAKVYLKEQSFEKAVNEFTQLLKVGELSNFQRITVMEGLGDTFALDNQDQKAVSQYEKALRLALENMVTPKITDLNSKLAEVYARQNNTGAAEGFFTNSLQLAESENPKRALREKEKVADFYNKNNLFDKEIELRKSSLQQAKKLQRSVGDKEVNNRGRQEDSITPQKINYKIANAFIAQDRYREAIPYLQESIAEADEEEDLVVQKDATRKLSEVYRTVGDYTKALESYQEYVTLVDELYVKKEQEISRASRFSRDITLKQNRINSLEKDRELSESKFELALKDQELIVANNKRQRIIIYSLILGMTMLALVIFLFYRTNRQQHINNHLLALKSFRSQMNPHFIFNALNSVNQFIAESDERSANRYLSEFSRLMRSVLENSEEDFIPLRSEIDLLELYVKLEHSRFKDKFDYHIVIDEELDIDSFRIPPMLLQPYIENAIWHGLRYTEEKGQLQIIFSRYNENTVSIIIEDNGIGRKRSAVLKTQNQKKQKSRGMGIIQKRIAILNRMYKQKIEVQVHDLNKDGTGTCVRVLLKRV
ncbi:histidine kinase [Ascidiimonas aurantiaca]|uniref:histidine kinase n=1 Tax=Ascidiimonas aurantiaca TaxID=1685432 RepID=UPI0030EC68AA